MVSAIRWWQVPQVSSSRVAQLYELAGDVDNRIFPQFPLHGISYMFSSNIPRASAYI